MTIQAPSTCASYHPINSDLHPHTQPSPTISFPHRPLVSPPPSLSSYLNPYRSGGHLLEQRREGVGQPQGTAVRPHARVARAHHLTHGRCNSRAVLLLLLLLLGGQFGMRGGGRGGKWLEDQGGGEEDREAEEQGCGVGWLVSGEDEERGEIEGAKPGRWGREGGGGRSGALPRLPIPVEPYGVAHLTEYLDRAPNLRGSPKHSWGMQERFNSPIQCDQ